MAAARHVDQVTAVYRAEALRVIAAARAMIARTDVNAHYDFKSVPSGQYRVFAAHKVFKNDLHWIVPIEVKSGPNRIDLSNTNAGRPF
jgi:hypothetical protein